MTSAGGQCGGRHEKKNEGDDGLGVLTAQMRADEEHEHDAHGQAGQCPAVGENLHGRSPPETTQGRREEDDDEYDVEGVHAALSAPGVTTKGAAGAGARPRTALATRPR